MAEHIIQHWMQTLTSGCGVQCLSSLQLATCIVRSAPSCPDVACIAELLAERAP